MDGIRDTYMHQNVSHILRLSISTGTRLGFCRPQTNFTGLKHSAHVNVDYISQPLYNMINVNTKLCWSFILKCKAKGRFVYICSLFKSQFARFPGAELLDHLVSCPCTHEETLAQKASLLA